MKFIQATLIECSSQKLWPVAFLIGWPFKLHLSPVPSFLDDQVATFEHLLKYPFGHGKAKSTWGSSTMRTSLISFGFLLLVPAILAVSGPSSPFAKKLKNTFPGFLCWRESESGEEDLHLQLHLRLKWGPSQREEQPGQLRQEVQWCRQGCRAGRRRHELVRRLLRCQEGQGQDPEGNS